MTHKDFFFQILDILEAQQIEYCLIAGTLLGAIRDNDFLINDIKDTDIALDDSQYWRVRQLLEKYIQKGAFKWYGIKRKELTVCDNANQFKVDMFFMQKHEDKYYLYSYLPNSKDGKWNREWRLIFSKDAFFPAKEHYFLFRYVKIPNNPEKILTEEYGDWKTPNEKWFSDDKTVLNVDRSYNGFSPADIDVNMYKLDNTKYDVGFACVNFERKQSTKECILSIKRNYKNIKIYVADQDEPSGEMIEFYELNNVQYYFVPRDSGLSYCRNLLIENISEPYTLIADNDFIFTQETKLEIFQYLLQHSSADIIGGRLIENDNLKTYERILFPYRNILLVADWEYLYNHKLIDFDYCGKYRIGYADIIFNFFLAKTFILQKYPWDNQHKIHSEHLDFFLNLRLNAEVIVAFTPDVIAIHNHDEKYESPDMRNRMFYNLIYEKYGIRKGYCIGENAILNYEENKREKI